MKLHVPPSEAGEWCYPRNRLSVGLKALIKGSGAKPAQLSLQRASSGSCVLGGSSDSPLLPQLVPWRCTRKGGTRPGTEERLNLESLPFEAPTVNLISRGNKIRSENRPE